MRPQCAKDLSDLEQISLLLFFPSLLYYILYNPIAKVQLFFRLRKEFLSAYNRLFCRFNATKSTFGVIVFGNRIIKLKCCYAKLAIKQSVKL